MAMLWRRGGRREAGPPLAPPGGSSGEPSDDCDGVGAGGYNTVGPLAMVWGARLISIGTMSMGG